VKGDFVMPSIATEKATIYYETHGNGPPVVFAHGGGGNTIEWFQQIPAFAKRYRCILFDHRGWGRSHCDVDDIHPRYFAGDAFAVMDDLGIERCAIIAHAIGGWTALAAGIEAPDRVACIAMSGTAGGVLTERLLHAFATGPGQAVGTREIVNAVTAPSFENRQPELMFLMRQLGRLNQNVGPAMLRLLDPATGVTVERLKGYRVPTLAIGGAESRVIPPDVLREAVAVIPGAEFYEMPGAGHAPPFENAAAYNAVVLDYLAKHYN
jgi:pimeloyl-ACP methyl ester carboxylesterase